MVQPGTNGSAVARSYFSVGTVGTVPPALHAALQSLADDTAQEVEFRTVWEMAGPNDILQFTMSAEFWFGLAPWVLEKLATGAVSFAGAQLVARFFRTKLEKRIDAVSEKVDSIDQKMDTIDSLSRSRISVEKPRTAISKS